MSDQGKEKNPPLFDEALVAGLILEWQATGEERTFNEILEACESTINWMLWRFGFRTDNADRADTRQKACIKLFKILLLYDPVRGRAFSFINNALQRFFISEFNNAAPRRQKEAQLFVEDIDIERIRVESETEPPDREKLKEIARRIHGLKTPRRKPAEREIQRWIVRVLLETDFRPRRHEVAETLRKVFRLSPERSRFLYDLTLVSVRRELLAERALAALNLATLTSKGEKALLRYRDRLSPPEFARLVFLMRGLSPDLIEEFSLEEILHGFRKERLLFAYWSRGDYKPSPEARAKMRAAKLGLKHSRETRRRMSAALRGRLRGALPPEHRAKISAAKIGHEVSAKTRARMSAANRGRTISAEHKAKISAANRGRTFSPEHRAKLSAASRAAFERKHRPFASGEPRFDFSLN
jgi:hypothetical protein